MKASVALLCNMYVVITSVLLLQNCVSNKPSPYWHLRFLLLREI